MNQVCETLMREFAAVPEAEPLPEDLTNRLQQHFAECAECTERYAYLLVLAENVSVAADASVRIHVSRANESGALSIPPAQPTQALRGKTLTPPRSRRILQWTFATVTAVAACLLLAIFLWPGRPSGPPTPPTAVALRPIGWSWSAENEPQGIPPGWTSFPDGAWVHFEPITVQNRSFAYIYGEGKVMVDELALLASEGWKVRVHGPRFTLFGFEQADPDQGPLTEADRQALARAFRDALPQAEPPGAEMPEDIVLAWADTKAFPERITGEIRGPAEPEQVPAWAERIEALLEEHGLNAFGTTYHVRN